jgi:Domain of unknown function (DUF4124)
MDIRFTPSRLLALLLASTLALPVSAGGVYKAVAADGTILVSDIPPPPDARIVQGPTGGTTAAAPAPGMPSYELAESDGAVARANTLVDLAEHQLAVARQGLSSPQDGLRLATARMTQGDAARVAFYKKGVLVARQQLMDVLRQRQAPLQLASR